MRIGILTFHWATNYGAILQCMALQDYLVAKGHCVEIINYKPSQFDFSWLSYIKHPRSKLPMLRQDIKMEKKEKLLIPFRRKYLHLTQRFSSPEDLQIFSERYNLLITGSDQVLNSSFVMGTEPTPNLTYFLDFASAATKCIGYAVSFGAVNYDKKVSLIVKSIINHFEAISVRENTGNDVLLQMGYMKRGILVPDPTLLYGKEILSRINFSRKETASQPYLYSYILHNDDVAITEEGLGFKIKYETDRKERTIESWLGDIYNSKGVITNSYHGMIMCILMHIPFVVFLSRGNIAGMNDRFDTLLGILGLKERIYESNNGSIKNKLHNPIDWSVVDAKLDNFRNIGIDFLKPFVD